MNPSSQPPPACSIVIVSWNVRDLLRACLASLPAAANAPAYGADHRRTQDAERRTEVIVVDNGSTDGSVAMVRAEFPGVRVLAETVNHGFAHGNNLGIAASRGRLVLLLNPDTIMEPGSLVALAHYLEGHPAVGLVGPRLLNPDGSPQSSRRRFPTWGTGLIESTPLQPLLPRLDLLRRYYVLDRADDEAQPVDWLSGACMLARRVALAQVRGFDPGYFMYSEELDLCRRLRAAGWEIGYEPAARVIHYGGQSSDQDIPARHIRFNQAKLRYFARWHGRGTAAMLRLWLCALYAWQGGLEAGKWLLGHRRALRRARMALYGQVVRALWQADG
ncbi:MAG: glycosyltransferase family 2 protein [Chloroflexota bacterium]|nr:glycosyltransferase family 2 protein [Chloroflexota bacterium]